MACLAAGEGTLNRLFRHVFDLEFLILLGGHPALLLNRDYIKTSRYSTSISRRAR
jgi:hypothetical protein